MSERNYCTKCGETLNLSKIEKEVQELSGGLSEIALDNMPNSATGDITCDNQKLVDVADPVNDQDVITKNYFDNLALDNLPSYATSNISCDNQRLVNVGYPSLGDDGATKGYVDGKISGNVYYCSSQTAITNALTAIGTGRGTIVIEGNITLSSTINISGGGSYVICGHGNNSQIVCGGDRSAFNITICVSCVLANFRIDATGLTTTAREVICINESSNNSIKVESVAIVGNGTMGDGIHIDSQNCRIICCDISSLNKGIYVHDCYNYVAGNHCNQNLMYGIVIDHQWNEVNGNHCISNASSGIRVSNNYNVVNGNHCINNTVDGIMCTTGTGHNNIVGNYCYGNQYGIRVYTSGFNNISGNYCAYNNPVGVVDNVGIYITDTSDYNSINGNFCEYNTNSGAGTGYGIYIKSTCGYNTVLSNVCKNNDVNYLNSGTNTFDSTATDGDPLNNVA